MPTYDYVCAACRHTFEQFQEMSARKLRKCPACGKSALERQVGTGAGLIFKGSGFYITDYRSDSYKQSAKAESGAASSGESAKSEAKPDASKPDAKPDAKPAADTKPAKVEPKPEPKAASKSAAKPIKPSKSAKKA